jgi:hypothetical protein
VTLKQHTKSRNSFALPQKRALSPDPAIPAGKSKNTLVSRIELNLDQDGFLCFHCEVRFPTTDDLVTHVALAIMKVPEAQGICLHSECTSVVNTVDKGVYWKNKKLWTEHLQRHVGNAHCTVFEGGKQCGYKTKAANDLYKHYRTRHSALEKNVYECEICKAKFGRQDILTRHMETHEVCNFSFISKYQ